MTVDEIVSDTKIEMVKVWLTKHGYTGLVDTDIPCDCNMNDIAPCDPYCMRECKPGHVAWCKDCSKKDTDDCEFPESTFCVSLKKEE